MAVELDTILLGAAAGCILVAFAARRGYLGHARRRDLTAATGSEKSHVPPTGRAEAPSPAEPAPSPAPAIYEAVQPAIAPPASFSASSASATTASQRPKRSYKRRTAPRRPTASKTTPNPEDTVTSK